MLLRRLKKVSQKGYLNEKSWEELTRTGLVITFYGSNKAPQLELEMTLEYVRKMRLTTKEIANSNKAKVLLA